MDIELIYKIKSNITLDKYLKDNSYWYKYLNRNKLNYKVFEEEMKRTYKLTPKDKMEKITNSINTISKFMDILK